MTGGAKKKETDNKLKTTKTWLKFTSAPGLVDQGTQLSWELLVFNILLTKHWSQLRPVTRRLQKQSPLTGSHCKLPDTVPRWSHRQAGCTERKTLDGKSPNSSHFTLTVFFDWFTKVYYFTVNPDRQSWSNGTLTCWLFPLFRLSGDTYAVPTSWWR